MKTEINIKLRPILDMFLNKLSLFLQNFKNGKNLLTEMESFGMFFKQNIVEDMKNVKKIDDLRFVSINGIIGAGKSFLIKKMERSNLDACTESVEMWENTFFDEKTNSFSYNYDDETFESERVPVFNWFYSNLALKNVVELLVFQYYASFTRYFFVLNYVTNLNRLPRKNVLIIERAIEIDKFVFLGFLEPTSYFFSGENSEKNEKILKSIEKLKIIFYDFHNACAFKNTHFIFLGCREENKDYVLTTAQSRIKLRNREGETVSHEYNSFLFDKHIEAIKNIQKERIIAITNLCDDADESKRATSDDIISLIHFIFK